MLTILGHCKCSLFQTSGPCKELINSVGVYRLHKIVYTFVSDMRLASGGCIKTACLEQLVPRR
jgi:hypothetical protein